MLLGLYNGLASDSVIRMHAAGCKMLKALKRGMSYITEDEAKEASVNQGFKVVYCKCTITKDD